MARVILRGVRDFAVTGLMVLLLVLPPTSGFLPGQHPSLGMHGSADVTIHYPVLAFCAGVDELPGTVNHFLGHDSAKWRTPSPTSAKVRYKGVNPVLDPVGLYDPILSAFHLRNTNSGGVAHIAFGYGPPGSNWIPVAGDWDRDGDDSVGLYDPVTSTFHLRNTNTGGVADLAFRYGPPGANWKPVAGDWNGDGTDTVGLYDQATSAFHLRNSHAGGGADVVVIYGPPGANWKPVVGDWNGDGIDTIGLYDPVTSTFHLRNANSGGVANIVFGYGPAGAGWLPLAGDWNGDGTDTIGLYDPVRSAFHLRDTNSGGVANIAFGYGPAGAEWLPATGGWDIGSGTWNGTWQSTLMPSASGTFQAQLIQSGQSLSGTITITGAPLITSGTIDGILQGDEMRFNVISGGLAAMALIGTVLSNNASGTYFTLHPDTGTWLASKQ